MTNKLEIVVTQEDIDKGKQGQGCSCPIALAVRRKLEGTFPIHLVTVGCDTIRVGMDAFYLPLVAREFVSSFDSYGKSYVEPFSFTTQEYGEWETL